MNLRNLVCIQTEENVEMADEYYNSLQRYSTLYRILLSRPYKSDIHFGNWNRIDIKLVNELGLKLSGKQKTNCWLQVSVQLLQESTSGTIHAANPNTYQIVCRPIKLDAWEFNDSSDICGFHNNTEGNVEYMISMTDEAMKNDGVTRPDTSRTHFYIQIYPTCQKQQNIQAFPLVVGPLTLKHVRSNDALNSHDDTPNGVLIKEWNDKLGSQNIYHAYRLLDQSYLMIKEDWKLGTPGKMWDSALVLSQILSDKISSDPMRFKGHRLLDLSAGTGCVGLLIASLYKRIYNDDPNNLPQITMTDLPEALDLIHENCALNRLKKYVDIDSLSWGSYEDARKVLKSGPIDTIIASDVLYKPASFPLLIKTLDWLSAESRNIDIFLGYKKRGLSSEDEASFFKLCNEIFDILALTKNWDDSDGCDKQNINKDPRGWIVASGVSDIYREAGVHIYKLIRR